MAYHHFNPAAPPCSWRKAYQVIGLCLRMAEKKTTSSTFLPSLVVKNLLQPLFLFICSKYGGFIFTKYGVFFMGNMG
jgi:hypothetical protein